MAAVDSLLKIVTNRNARTLTVAGSRPPVLDRGKGPEPLSMPPLSEELVATFVSEVFDVEARRRLDSGDPVEGMYDDGDGERFAVSGNRQGTGVRLEFTRIGGGGGVSKPPAQPAPPTRAPIAPTSTVAPPPRPAPGAPPPLASQPPALSPAIHSALAYVEHSGASDLLISSQLGARVRIGGQLRELEVHLDDRDVRSLLGRASDAHAEELSRRGSCDFGIDRRAEGGLRYRVNVFHQHRGIAAALRPIRSQPPTLRQLNLPDSFRELVAHPHGMVVVTGQTGSGKSTTLVALIEHLNRTAARHVITLEDPIEYEYSPGLAMVHQREIGTHVADFATGLRAALRENPDVILVGEMRDPETIAAALTAAETGHLVLSTLHAASAEMALDRIIDAFPANQQHQVRAQLSAVLRATLTQFLLPTTSPPNRVPAYELMRVNSGIAAMIREGKTHQIQSQVQTGRDDGMVPLDRVLGHLVRTGEITAATARTIARDPVRLT